MSEHVSEPGQDDPVHIDDDFVGEPPAGDATPGDYMSNDQNVSPETGTWYEPDGEPASTPHDEELLREEDEGEA